MDTSTEPPLSPPPAANNNALENFKSLMVKCIIIASSATQSLTSPQKTLIQRRIHEIVPNLSTPHHPPYAWMIENAIEQLNEKGGSSEEAISQFIAAKYKQHLPWAHTTLVKLHIQKLCEGGNLVEKPDGCFLIGKAHNTSHPSPNPSPSPSPSLSSCSSSSSSSSSSSDSEYDYFTSTSSSSNGKMSKKQRINYEQEIRSKRWKEKASENVQGRGRGRARGRGRSRGRKWNSCQPNRENVMEGEGEMEIKVYMYHIAREIKNLMMAEELANENIQRQQQVHGKDQDSANAPSQADQSIMVTDVESLEQEDGVHEQRIGLEQQEKIGSGDSRPGCSTVPLSYRKQLTSQQGQGLERKRGRPRKKSISPKHALQPGRGRGRPRKKVLKREETGKNMEPPEAAAAGIRTGLDKLATGEQDQLKENQPGHPSAGVYLTDDESLVPEWLTYDFPPAMKSNLVNGEIEKHAGQVEPCDEDLDELVEEIYVEFKGASQTPNSIIKDQVAEGIAGGEEQHQRQGNQNSAIVDSQVKSSTVVIKIEENHLMNTYEVLEEESRKIVQLEVITEQNQSEEKHCIDVHTEKEEIGEYDNYDERSILEKESNEDHCSPGNPETDVLEEQPYRQNKEDRILQSEEQSREVAVAEHDQQIEMSKGSSGDNAGYCSNMVLTMDQLSESTMLNEQKRIMERQTKLATREYVMQQNSEISSPDTYSEVKSMEDSSTILSRKQLDLAPDKPQLRKFQPKAPKCVPDFMKKQLSITSLENPSETNRCPKLRLCPSKIESDEVADRAISSSSKPGVQKQ